MALIEALGRPHIECPRCRTTVVWPTDLPDPLKHQLAAVTRHDTLEGMQFAEKHIGLATREAKALALHITKAPGGCHRCGLSVSAGESVCSCRCANIDW